MPLPAMSVAVNDDDAGDVTGAAAGDHEAFARIYDRHAAVVLSLCRSAPDAEDASQETFIRAFGMLPGLVQSRTRGNGIALRPWLYAIARRVCAECRRAARRRLKHERAANQEERLMIANNGFVKSDVGEEANRCAKNEQLERLSQAMDQLDDRERLAVHLHYLDRDPAQSAESALGLSRSGYYKLLARAHERLAGLMKRDEALRHEGT